MRKCLGYRFYLLLAFSLVVLCLLIGHGASWAGDQPATLVVAIPTYIDSFDPTDYRSRLTEIVLKNIYESLTTRDASFTVRPLLAGILGLSRPFDLALHLGERGAFSGWPGFFQP